MTIASHPTPTPACAPWCNDHFAGEHGEHCNRLVAQLEGGEHEYVEITTAGGDTRVSWSRTESDNFEYVRAFADVLLVAADMIESPQAAASPEDI